MRQIREELTLLGFSCNEFINKDQSINSQALLIAAGWFISSQDIMDLFVAKLNSQIDDEYFKEKAFQVTEEFY